METMEGSSTGKVRRLVIGVALISVGAYAVVSGVIRATDNMQMLVAPSGVIEVEVADTPELMAKGLSGRSGLADDQGMLFVFNDASGSKCFWMKDMQFSIDMIWLDDQKTVLNVVENVHPDSYPELYCPEGLAVYGLEVAGGRADQLGLKSGETIRF